MILNCDGAVESLRISRSELPMDAGHFDHDVPGLYRDRPGYVWSTIHLVSRVEGFAAGMFKLVSLSRDRFGMKTLATIAYETAILAALIYTE